MINISLSFDNEELDADINIDGEFVADFGEITEIHTGHLPYYEGSYSVVPRKAEQVLETENKSMKENVKISPITYSSVDNLFGGQTVTIGLE